MVQCRDITSLDRRPAYQLVFLTVKAAKSFAAFAINAFSNPHRSHWPAGIRFPPASRPEFVHLDQGIRRIVQQQEDISDLLYSGIEGIEGHYVLLTICGLAGRTVQTGLLPRTYQVRQILAARNVGLVEKRGVDAVARIIRERKTKDGTYRPIMADGRGTGFEARWLVRCVSESEAQRVVRDLHMTPSWEGGGLFRAEVIY